MTKITNQLALEKVKNIKIAEITEESRNNLVFLISRAKNIDIGKNGKKNSAYLMCPKLGKIRFISVDGWGKLKTFKNKEVIARAAENTTKASTNHSIFLLFVKIVADNEVNINITTQVRSDCRLVRILTDCTSERVEIRNNKPINKVTDLER